MDLNNRIVHHSDHGHVSKITLFRCSIIVRYSGYGLNNNLEVRYSGHGLNYRLVKGRYSDVSLT